MDSDLAFINGLDDNLTVQVAQKANDMRWQIEQFHREIKQLTGSEKYQCRKARFQRNHLACCYPAWVTRQLQHIRGYSESPTVKGYELKHQCQSNNEASG